MFDNVLSISSGTCVNSEYETIDHATCANLASSRNVAFRTVSNTKYARGCVQDGNGSVYYNDTPLVGGDANHSSDAVQQLCMLPNTRPDVVNDGAAKRSQSKSDGMFDGTWLDKSVSDGVVERSGRKDAGYFPVNINTIHQAVFYVNP